MSHPTPKISVVITVYNAERYIAETLDSILAQTYTDWELIVINDMSTDKTLDILNEYAGKDNRILVETVQRDKRNTSHTVSRQVGIDKARGAYLAFMDGDDLYETDAFEVLSRYLDEHPECKCVYGFFREVDESGRFIEPLEFRHWNDLTDAHWQEDYQTLHSWENIILQRIPMMLQKNMVRREFFDAVGGLHPTIIWDDYFLFVRMACADKSAIHRIPHQIFRYRYNMHGISKSTEMFKRLLSNVSIIVKALTEELNVQQHDNRFDKSYLSAKMYADIAWLRFRSGLYDQTRTACWYGFRDTHVTLEDWWHFCAGLYFKTLMPDSLWEILRNVKHGIMQTLKPSATMSVKG